MLERPPGRGRTCHGGVLVRQAGAGGSCVGRAYRLVSYGVLCRQGFEDCWTNLLGKTYRWRVRGGERATEEF